MMFPIWKGRQVNTYEALLNVLVRVEDKAEALEFIQVYEAVNPHARENIGWAVGDLSREQGRKVMELFNCPHPVFGMTYPTAEEAYRAGLNAAKNLLSGQKTFKNPNPWFVGALEE